MQEQTSISTTDSLTFKKTLPPIRSLIEEAWHLFTRKVLKILLVSLFAIAGYIAFVIIAGAILVGVGFISADDVSNVNDLMSSVAGGSFVVTLVIVILAFIVFSIIFSLTIQAAYLLLLDDKNEDTSIIDYIKRGMHVAWPLFLTGLINGFMVLGGYFLFVIPGVIMSIFFIFYSYIVVLQQKRGLEALRLSAGMVSQNFGGILGRLVLFFLFAIVGQSLFSGFGSAEAPPLMTLAGMIVNTAVGWFGMCYTYLLYKQAREAYDPARKTSITWMWIVAILGYVIGTLLIMGIASLVSKSDVLNILKNQLEDGMQNDSPMQFDSESPYEYDPELNQEEIPTNEEYDQLLEQLMEEGDLTDQPPV